MSEKFTASFVVADRPIPSCGFHKGLFTINLCIDGIGAVRKFKINLTIPYEMTIEEQDDRVVKALVAYLRTLTFDERIQKESSDNER